jgi:hypothetical protein
VGASFGILWWLGWRGGIDGGREGASALARQPEPVRDKVISSNVLVPIKSYVLLLLPTL